MTGAAMFAPYVLEYAPKETRYRQIIARLRKMPNLMDQAKTEPDQRPAVWNSVAQQENDGNIDLIENTVEVRRSGGSRVRLRQRRPAGRRCAAGIQRVAEDGFVETKRATGVWAARITRRSFKYALATGKAPAAGARRGRGGFEGDAG